MPVPPPLNNALPRRRVLRWVAGILFCLLAVAVFARLRLTGLAVDSLLRLAGASEIRFNLTSASPWEVSMQDVGFHYRTQPFSAKRVTFARDHWWTPSLGAVSIEQALLPLTIDGSDTNPSAWPTYQNGTATVQPLRLPAERISLDGRIVVQAASLPDQTLTVKIAAHLSEHGHWVGEMQADGPGLNLKADGTFDPTQTSLAFTVPEIALDLKDWQDFLQRVLLIPGGAWLLEGKVSGSANGRLEGKALTAGGTFHLRNGRAQNDALAVTAEGVEADLEVVDADKFLTKPGTVRVRELRAGQLPLRDLEAEVAFEGMEKLIVTRVSLQALDGRVAAEPFKYYPRLRELDAVLLVDGINLAEVLALTKDLPAQATGRVNGRLPVRIDGSGVRLGTGWLELKPGVYAEIRFNATGLLTNGVAPGSPSYAVLKKIESGLLKLKLGELRLDIRPPNVPAGRSAQLHLVGEPVDPEVKAPVTLDLNVNGPLEQLLHLGLDSRVKIGTKP